MNTNHPDLDAARGTCRQLKSTLEDIRLEVEPGLLAATEGLLEQVTHLTRLLAFIEPATEEARDVVATGRGHIRRLEGALLSLLDGRIEKRFVLQAYLHLDHLRDDLHRLEAHGRVDVDRNAA